MIDDRTEDKYSGDKLSKREKVSRWLCLLSVALLIMAPLWIYQSWSATVQAGWIPANWPLGSGPGNQPWGQSNHGPWHVFKELGYGFNLGMKLFFWSFICACVSCVAKPNVTAGIVLTSSVLLAFIAFFVFLPLFD